MDYDLNNLRIRRALHGRDEKSFGHFKQAGAAFAALNLVVFALAVCCGFESIFQPANLRSQDAGDLPMQRWVALRKCADDVRAVAKQICNVRAFLRHMFLVAAYIANEPAPLRRYLYCFVLSRSCRLLRAHGSWRLPAHLFLIFFEGRFA